MPELNCTLLNAVWELLQGHSQTTREPPSRERSTAMSLNILELISDNCGQKLEDDPGEPKCLLTDPYWGYRMADVISSCGLGQRQYVDNV
jgi:hypothetical protein